MNDYERTEEGSRAENLHLLYIRKVETRAYKISTGGSEGAKEYFEWALRIFRDKLDGDHPTTKIILINLYLLDPS